MNLEQAHYNMVERQVRCWDVFDEAVLDVLRGIPREHFTPENFRALAYADLQIPLGHGQVMFRPVLEGRLLQAMELQPGERVLEVGTGSGYLTACISALAGPVLSVDCFPEFIDQAHRSLSGVEYRDKLLSESIELRHADVFKDFDPGERFAAVIVTGSVESLPEAFIGWLADDARMFIVTDRSPVMQAQLVYRRGGGPVITEGLLETDVPPLLRDEPPKPFRF